MIENHMVLNAGKCHFMWLNKGSVKAPEIKHLKSIILLLTTAMKKKYLGLLLTTR